MGDEGFGIHALDKLRHTRFPNNSFELIDGGVLGLNLLPLILDCSHLMVIDAVDAGEAQGKVIELGKEDLLSPVGIKLSEHQIGFQEVLGIAHFRGSLPTHLSAVGVQPKTITLSTQLSPEALESMGEVLRRVGNKLKEWYS